MARVARNDQPDRMSRSRRFLVLAAGTLVLAAAHHLYGGATPWRVEGAVAALLVAGAVTAIAALGLAATRRGARARRSVGDTVAPRELVTAAGEPVALPDPVRLTHLQFRRFAGCPICNLHLRRFRSRHIELLGAGIREVVVFHSPPDELREHAGGLPFAVIADPEKRLYAEFGVEAGARSLLDPRAWPTIARAVVRSAVAIARGRERAPSLTQRAGRLGLPADFLIDSDGRIVACKYGDHADDQWSVDEVLAAGAADAVPPDRGARPSAGDAARTAGIIDCDHGSAVVCAPPSTAASHLSRPRT